MRQALLLLLAVTAVASPAAGQTGNVNRASLTVGIAPLSVRGFGFRAGEHVRVVADARGRHTGRATASRRGAFVVRWRDVSVRSCDGYVVSARGDRGSRATVAMKKTECPPPPPPDDPLYPRDPPPKR